VSLAIGAVPEATRRRDLRRMKAFSLGLLLLAVAIFLVCLRVENAQGAAVAVWVVYLRTAAEAGVVGGLADWFAVTALFRHPLGLPIPHTAIIPTRKDAIGRSLGEFVGENFLAEAVVRERLRRADIAGRFGMWLARPENAERVTAELATGTRAVLGVLHDEDVQAVIEQTVTRRIAAIPAGPPLGRLLGQLVDDGAHRGLVDLSVESAHDWLIVNRAAVIDAIARQAPGWTPRFVDEKVAERVHAEVLRVVTEVRDNPDHDLRHSLDAFLVSFARDLREDPVLQAKVEVLKLRLLEHPAVRKAVGDLGATVRRMLLEAVDDPYSELRRRVEEGLASFGAQLRDDPVLRGKVDGWLEDVVAHLTSSYRDELTTVITDTVERWDGRETARRIELQVGPDLQFIRINGTVVGALAGLVIAAVAQLIG
jgi:uncharacterized membrane-anchored protein YjiN (DUF445 family)